jgi:putative FmdB family regulatory protein
MPFYEYECQACGDHHEALQKINDAPLKKCPHCGKSRLKKLISAPVFRLKGGGWYETDFKSDGEKKRNLAGDDKPAAEADAKPAAAAATKPKADATAESKPAVAPKPDPKPPRATTRQGGAKAPKAKTKTKPKAPARRR